MKIYGATILLAAGIFVSAPAMAGDVKVFPGTMCVQLGTDSTVYYNDQGRVLNPSTKSAVEVICPIVRDSTTTKWMSLEVVVADRNPKDPRRNPTPDPDLSCKAISAQEDGLYGGFKPETDGTTGAKINWWEYHTLTFGPPSQERNYGTYFLRCTIPAKIPGFASSGIYSYRIRESN